MYMYSSLMQVYRYGRPGVEFSNQTKNQAAITSIFTFRGNHQFVTVDTSNSVTLWELLGEGTSPTLEQKECFFLDPDGLESAEVCVKCVVLQSWPWARSKQVYTGLLAISVLTLMDSQTETSSLVVLNIIRYIAVLAVEQVELHAVLMHMCAQYSCTIGNSHCKRLIISMALVECEVLK